MVRWECQVCGYIYDTDKEKNSFPGDSSSEELPEDWICPKCGIEKEFFEKKEENVSK